ncbi:MAG TPA: class I SAM-dependent methyltransferase [Vicinamibacterales bacterium]|jgi:2-polyprenyl-3-methyl-5-hydroxy-6-metoxy-1,4-benzoquinol methylase|nr:class I SAM-dependent methyltransferase [Vicinamibacterales bacterium]
MSGKASTVLAESWTKLQAPRTGDLRRDFTAEAAEFLGISHADAMDRLATGGQRFHDQYVETFGAGRTETDADRLAQFYNQSDAELFELLEWHAADPIHQRTLVLRDFALQRPGRSYLDYGSGVGSDAVVFGSAGFSVTLADISDLLLAFAAFRCRRRGFDVKTIDLKKDDLPKNAYDVIVCFDVLEHIPDPLPIVLRQRDALRNDGLLAIHAPFGFDPDRPMHVVHRDVVTPRMRSLGFVPQNLVFPPGVWAPRIYEKAQLPAHERAAYRVYDGYLQNRFGDGLAALYRQLFRRSKTAAATRA